MHRLIVILLFTCIGGCTFTLPFQDSGKYRDAEMVAVGLTHAVLVEDAEQRSTFYKYSAKVIESLEDQPGYIGHSIRRTLLGKEAWTMTVWVSEEALNNFVDSEVHTAAIEAGISALKQSSFARVEVPRSAIPLSWEEAETLLEQSPRTY